MLIAHLIPTARTARSFASDRRGVSAIEFAFIAPLMISLYLGGVEVTQAVSVSRKSTLVARTVADLVAQDAKITNAAMQDVLNASSTVVTPYPVQNLKVTVSSIVIDSDGVAKVDWSDTLHGTARAKGSTIQLDAALAVPNTSLILGEVTYVFTPTFGSAITGTLNLSDRIFMRPRISPTVQRTPT